MTIEQKPTDVRALRQPLRDPDPQVRRRAARALDHLPLDDETVQALVDMIRVETIPQVRGAAVHALACDGCKPAACTSAFDMLGFLVDLLLHDPSAEVRHQTLEGLRGVNDQPRVQDAIRSALTDASKRVRGKAVYLLPLEEQRSRGLA